MYAFRESAEDLIVDLHKQGYYCAGCEVIYPGEPEEVEGITIYQDASDGDFIVSDYYITVSKWRCQDDNDTPCYDDQKEGGTFALGNYGDLMRQFDLRKFDIHELNADDTGSPAWVCGKCDSHYHYWDNEQEGSSKQSAIECCSE